MYDRRNSHEKTKVGIANVDLLNSTADEIRTIEVLQLKLPNLNFQV